MRIDPDMEAIAGERIPIGSDPAGIALGGGSLWVPLYGSGHLTRVDLPSGASTIRAARSGLSPTDAVIGFDLVWMANNGEDSVTPVGARGGG